MVIDSTASGENRGLVRKTYTDIRVKMHGLCRLISDLYSVSQAFRKKKNDNRSNDNNNLTWVETLCYSVKFTACQ